VRHRPDRLVVKVPAKKIGSLCFGRVMTKYVRGIYGLAFPELVADKCRGRLPGNVFFADCVVSFFLACLV
jgi:hypothetical protein